MLIINEVRSTNKNTCGFTQVVVIDENGDRQSLDEVITDYEEYKNIVSDSYQNLFLIL